MPRPTLLTRYSYAGTVVVRLTVRLSVRM